MIRQYDAQRICDSKLKEYNLKKWKTSFAKSENYLARCYHDQRRIVFSQQFLAGADEKAFNDILAHELAHAIVGPGHGHNSIWVAKARELGLENPKPCADIKLDLGRSMQSIMDAQIVEKPKRNYHRIDKLCPICGKKAITVRTTFLNSIEWSMLECGHISKKEQIKSEGFDFKDWTSSSGKKLFPYQIEGIEFLERAGGRALIADEPGLGKTVQAFGFLLAHKEQTCPCIWTCKTTLRLQTLKEALDWLGPEFMAQIIYSPRHMIMPGLKLYIISMDLLRNMPTDKLESIGAKTIIADEIQHFKDPDATRTAELRKLVSMPTVEHFIPLSGTPWKNRGQEYYPVLNMLDSEKFPSYAKFKNDWVDYYVDKDTGKVRQGGIRDIPRFREYTKHLIIRRLRDDVLPNLPKINRNLRFIDLEGVYEKQYDKEEGQVAQIIKAAIIDGKPPQFIASQLMRLKHITGLAKVKSCIEDVQQFLEQTEDWEKVCIFIHHIDVGDNLQRGDGLSYSGLDDWLKDNGYNPSLRLFGGRGAVERNDIIQKFKDDVRNRVLIASTLASGEGLNIQFCRNPFILERQWNPANEEQAEFRFSRPLTEGDLPSYLRHLAKMTQPLVAPYFIAEGTVDSMLTKIIERKRHEFRRTMNEKDMNLKWEENDIIRELAEMILKKRYGGGKAA
jgi:SNF2 family DNA or RNA helicase